MAKKILPCKDKGYEFDVPLIKKDGTFSRKVAKMRIHTVFKYSDTNFEYYLEQYSRERKEWIFQHRLIKHSDIKKYFK